MENYSIEEKKIDKFQDYEKKLLNVIPQLNNARTVVTLDARTLKESDFRKNWLHKNKACLIKNAVEHWPAVHQWKDKEYWLSASSDFKVKTNFHSNYNQETNIEGKSEITSFHDAIERLHEKKDAIFSIPGECIEEGTSLAKVNAEIGNFKFLSKVKRPRSYFHKRIFIYRNAATAWHYHNVDETLMCQVNGAKKVALLTPEIPRPKYVSNFLTQELQLEGDTLDDNIDLRPLIVEVEEGDALYIPPYWYHAVVPSDNEIGYTLAFCWRSPWHKLGDFSNFFVRELYKKAIWPVNTLTFVFPFLGAFAFMNFLYQKLTRTI
ncbi:cupin-like domain-containing protein [Spongiimicrobium salis]|uniref:cupin-like domain-containing protein n=1 Tax=Spongiimicrobium salis TaxID=1667022 RepID=UPI00374DDEF6